MKKVLVLEDESSIRSFIVINLRRAGYDVIEAETGEEALEKLKENPDVKVALLDIIDVYKRQPLGISAGALEEISADPGRIHGAAAAGTPRGRPSLPRVLALFLRQHQLQGADGHLDHGVLSLIHICVPAPAGGGRLRRRLPAVAAGGGASHALGGKRTVNKL